MTDIAAIAAQLSEARLKGWMGCCGTCERGDGICCPDEECDIEIGLQPVPRYFCQACEWYRSHDTCFDCGAPTTLRAHLEEQADGE